MGKNTSISLGTHFEKFIDLSIDDGRFNNASEVIRAGLRLLEEEENKLRVLKKSSKKGLVAAGQRILTPKNILPT